MKFLIIQFHHLLSLAEYLHSVCIGVVKRLVELTFSVGDVRPRITKRKLSNPETFNKLMSLILTPKEFPRRARDLDFSVFKATEFRNILIFYFPLVISCIDEGHGEIKLWLYLAYAIRSYILPSEEFECVDRADIKDCCTKFYKLYEQLMGQTNYSYNTHVVCSHLLDMRFHGPLTLTSAFIFENFYGEMRKSFVPGTVSPLKQIFQKILLKRKLSRHSCESPIFYSNYKTSLENNSYVYCWEQNVHNMYIIEDIIDDETFLCKKIGKYAHDFKETNKLNWSKVGVYKKGGIGPQNYIIKKKDIAGKVIEVQDFLITCPNNILREK